MNRRRPFADPTMRRAIAWLAAFVWLWQGLAPAAAPPTPTADGRIVLVICTTHGLQKLVIDADGNVVDGAPDDDQGAGPHDCPCPAACGHIALTPPEPALARSVVRAAPVVVAPPPRFAVAPPVRGPPLGSRAPPLSPWMI